MSLPCRLPPLATAVALFTLLLAETLPAQSLRGSRASIDRMHRHARSERLSFFETPASVRRQVAAGRLVRLVADESFTLHRVGYPYVRPATRTFVQRLAGQYVDACGKPLIVTSAVRPATRQPANSASRSVHPTGMAIDLRKPTEPRCLRWLRTVLLDLERAGVIEATEEFSPPHLHVAVYPTPYGRYAAARAMTNEPERTSTYTVRTGDTLWSIARSHDTTVDAITDANALRKEIIQPGQELRIPVGDGGG